MPWIHCICERKSRVPVSHRHLSYRKIMNLPWFLSCCINYLNIYLEVSTIIELRPHSHTLTYLVQWNIISEIPSWWFQVPKFLQDTRWTYLLTYMGVYMLIPRQMVQQPILILCDTKLVQSYLLLMHMLRPVKMTLCSTLLGLAYIP